MQIFEYKSQFGWENDNGVGLKLIQQIQSGEKTATTAPKSLHTCDELRELYESIGKPATVVDKHNQPHCNILILDVFETTFGSPDLRLVRGEGYGSDIESFKRAHLEAWQDLVESGKLELNDETVLIVEIFKLLA